MPTYHWSSSLNFADTRSPVFGEKSLGAAAVGCRWCSEKSDMSFSNDATPVVNKLHPSLTLGVDSLWLSRIWIEKPKGSESLTDVIVTSRYSGARAADASSFWVEAASSPL